MPARRSFLMRLLSLPAVGATATAAKTSSHDTHGPKLFEVTYNGSSVQLLEDARFGRGLAPGCRIRCTDGALREVAPFGTSPDETTRAGLALFEAGPQFSSRTTLVGAVQRGQAWQPGTRLRAGNEEYLVQAKARDFRDLPGMEALGELQPEHFGLRSPIRVPSDFDTLQEVFDRFGANRTRPVEVVIEAGHRPTSGFTLENGDFGNYRLRSEDVVVMLSERTEETAVFAEMTASRGPFWDILVDAGGRGRAGVSLRNSVLEVATGKGYRNTGTHGGSAPYGCNFFVYGGSNLYCASEVRRGRTEGLVASGAPARGIWVTFNSTAAIPGADLGECGSDLSFGIGHAGLFVSRGSQVQADNARFRGSIRGIRCARSQISAKDGDFTGTGQAIVAFDNGSVIASSGIFNRCGTSDFPVLQAGITGDRPQGKGLITAEHGSFNNTAGVIAKVFGAGGEINIDNESSNLPLEGLEQVSGRLQLRLVAHGLSDGDRVTLAGVPRGSALNGLSGAIRVIDEDHVALPADGPRAATPWEFGGRLLTQGARNIAAPVAQVANGDVFANRSRFSVRQGVDLPALLLAARDGAIHATGLRLTGSGTARNGARTDENGFISLSAGQLHGFSEAPLRNADFGGAIYCRGTRFDEGFSYPPLMTQSFASMGTGARDSLTDPAAGTVVFDTGLGTLCVFDGTGWRPLALAG
ncbi:hypothetical protein [Salipiger bermudensis]|uniref:hypothetical protein n=1 Tax=Salipiger bermudensis TaxID=344736 RepID=UPI001CD40312|nr:hypothetical protein [Salipiger bermudensis]MCA0964717.1 hypothetical protein [Salipiger bermudensis]